MTTQVCLVLLISVGAACMDLMWERISNSWIWSSWIVGILFQLQFHGTRGIGIYLTGAAVPFVILFPLFLFRMLGAGDVKLFSALGGIVGFSAIVKGMAISFLFGAVFSAAFLVVCGNMADRFKYLLHYFIRFENTRCIAPYFKRGKRMENIHFTIPILLGMMLYAGGFY